MPCLDSRGLPLSTSSDRAAALYREGIDLLLAAWPGADAMLDRAIVVDPDFALAHAARARLHAIRAEPDAARAGVVLADSLARRRGDARERAHVEILSLVIHGRARDALDRAIAHAETWPRDALILSLPLGAFGLFAFSGMAAHDQARVDFCERHSRHFGADDWWFLTCRGWAHAENGAVPLGRALTQRAFDLRRANANAVHALSHAMFEDGATGDADRLITGWLPEYDRTGPLHGHLAWHAALSALEDDDADRALALYARFIRPAASAGMPINVMSDAASLLWRVRSCGHAVPDEVWRMAAAWSAPRFPTAGFPFADVHMAMLASVTGDRDALDRRIAALDDLVASGRLAAGPVVPAICRALSAFAAGDDAACVRILEPVVADIVRIGGSAAQREVFEDTLLLALMRSGATDKARALLDRRLHRRPSRRDRRWYDALQT